MVWSDELKSSSNRLKLFGHNLPREKRDLHLLAVLTAIRRWNIEWNHFSCTNWIGTKMRLLLLLFGGVLIYIVYCNGRYCCTSLLVQCVVDDNPIDTTCNRKCSKSWMISSRCGTWHLQWKQKIYKFYSNFAQFKYVWIKWSKTNVFDISVYSQ